MTPLEKDLAEVARASTAPAYSKAHFEEQKSKALRFVVDHHAEIAQNARDIETLKDALFQLSVRLNTPREPDMDDMSWHTDMIARAQYLANQDRKLRALERALGEAENDDLQYIRQSFAKTLRKRADEIMREEGR